ncbi:MAG: hypothetical protein ACLS28_23275 [Clostridium neonatale]
MERGRINKEKIEVLQTANDYMNNLENGIVNLANMIQEGKEQEATTIIHYGMWMNIEWFDSSNNFNTKKFKE